MNKLKQLDALLPKILEWPTNPILAWSGGKDSTFLLSKIKQLGYDLPVLVFPHFWSEYQKEFIKKLIKEWKLQAFFYRPTSLKLEESQEKQSLKTIVAQYTLGKKHIPVLFDHIQEDSLCGIDVSASSLVGNIPYFIWDCVITGSKESDFHPLYPKLDFAEFDNIQTPLWCWSDEEVMEATRAEKFPYDPRVYDDKDEKADTGNFVGCLACVGVKEAYCPKVGKIIKGV